MLFVWYFAWSLCAGEMQTGCKGFSFNREKNIFHEAFPSRSKFYFSAGAFSVASS